MLLGRVIWTCWQCFAKGGLSYLLFGREKVVIFTKSQAQPPASFFFFLFPFSFVSPLLPLPNEWQFCLNGT
jgi:hypothetical protein